MLLPARFHQIMSAMSINGLITLPYMDWPKYPGNVGRIFKTRSYLGKYFKEKC